MVAARQAGDAEGTLPLACVGRMPVQLASGRFLSLLTSTMAVLSI
jgi:hypothetical protein